MSGDKNSKAKNWVFTLNNFTDEDEKRLKDLDCEWIIFGHEHLEDGTPHLQGAICFKGRRTFNSIKKIFPRIHLEVMHGSPQDSKTYCTKEDPNYFEKGEMPKGKFSSSRNKIDWEEVYKLATEGKFDDIRRDVYIRYHRSLKQLYFDAREDANLDNYGDKELKNHFLWLWGPTGTGKSHSARRIAKELGCERPYLKGLNKWWDGYDYQKVVIIEEADPKRCEYLAGYFKNWADKWSFYAETKGNTIKNCRPEYLIVTSNYSIIDCFPTPDDYIPMKRRFTEVKLENRDFQVIWPEQTDSNTGPASWDTGNTIPCPIPTE